MNKDKEPSISMNTMFLYVRMLFSMIVSLFTSRVILDALGVNDYGIYNVVGGFVLMFNVLCSGLSSTTQRFINFDLGRKNYKELKRTFSSCVHIYFFISVIIVLLSEIFGLWFLEHKMTIPDERLYAAKWVFHIALLTSVFNLISIPYNALIIAHEKMKAFAYISIYEVCAKLLIAYVIYIVPYDKLIFYALLMCLVQFSVRIIYTRYCKQNFKESFLLYKIDYEKIKELYSFAGWAMFGGLASIGFTQGINVLLNMFFGPTVNAARGIAVQVQQTVNSFVLNFQTAVNPRIIKAYASNDIKYMNNLVFLSSKYSFILIFIISLPLFIETHYILLLWLKNVPEYTVIFFRLIICTTIIDGMSNPFMRSADASGNVKLYQFVVGLLLLLIVPISYIILKLGYPPYSVFIVHLTICVIAFVVRLFIIQKIINYSISEYIKKVLSKVIIISIISPIIPILITYNMSESFYRLLTVTLISISITFSLSYTIALSKQEKLYVLSKVKKIWSK